MKRVKLSATIHVVIKSDDESTYDELKDADFNSIILELEQHLNNTGMVPVIINMNGKIDPSVFKLFARYHFLQQEVY